MIKKENKRITITLSPESQSKLEKIKEYAPKKLNNSELFAKWIDNEYVLSTMFISKKSK